MPENAEVFDVLDIMKHLPHRYPFLLVDRVTEVGEKGGKGFKNVTINEEFFQGHFPGRPIMPGVLMLEGIAQCAGYIAMKHAGADQEKNKDKIIFFMMIDKVKFRRPVVPGDRLDYEIEFIKNSGRIIKFKGKASVNGETATEAEMTAMLADK